MTDSFRSYTGRVPKVAAIGDKVRKRDILLMDFFVAENDGCPTQNTNTSSVLLVYQLLKFFLKILSDIFF